jgi:hypothetical protein
VSDAALVHGDQAAFVAVKFLERVQPGAPWILTAITPDGPIETRTFTSEDAARTWIQVYHGVRNLYWAVNPLLRAVSKKAEKTDVKEVRFLHVDIDPVDGKPLADEQKRIFEHLMAKRPSCIPEPTYIINSGSGYNALWLLEKPIPVNGDVKLAEDAELYNRQLAFMLDGDVPCSNVDRILRLPGTLNLPTEKKSQRGRVPAVAALKHGSKPGERVYSLAEFKQAAAPITAKAVVANVNVDVGASPRRLADINELDRYLQDPTKQPLLDHTKVVAVQGKHPDKPKQGDNSRSAWLYDCVCNLVRCGVPDDVVYSVITDPECGVSESVLEMKAKAAGYALRQIGKAKGAIEAEAADFSPVNEKGIPFPNQHNIRVALGKLGVRVLYNSFSDKAIIEGLPGFGPTLQDEAVVRLRLKTDQQFHFLPQKELFLDVVQDEARINSFHPVKDYLQSLEWDGTPRLDSWLSTYGGAEASEYTRAISAIVLIAAVRRVYKPGEKFDEVLVLKSPQGTGKSSALATLVPDRTWFSDDLPIGADAKVVIERTQGKWIIEAAELKGIQRRGDDVVKAFLSRSADVARGAWGRIPKEALRQFIIIGTTNEQKFLRDNTGNRRWWPVEVGRFDLSALARDRDQLWAEAAHREAAGESIRLDESLWSVAAKHQEENRLEDPYVDLLANAFGDREGKILNADLWDLLNIHGGQRTQELNTRIGNAMRELGFERKLASFGGIKAKGYVRAGATTRFPQRFVVIRAQDGRAHVEYEASPADHQQGVPF